MIQVIFSLIRKPSNSVCVCVCRDGISEAQFQQVLQYEINAIRNVR